MSWLDEAKAKRHVIEAEHQRQLDICNSVGPMVEKLLHDMGRAYWGDTQYKVNREAKDSWSLTKVKGKSETLEFSFNVLVEFPEDGPPRFYVFGEDRATSEDLSEDSLRSVLAKIYPSGPMAMKSKKPTRRT